MTDGPRRHLVTGALGRIGAWTIRAALQVPFCRADPPRGALVNVVGTVNVFEAVPFPSEIDHAGLAALGPIQETPVRDGIAESVEIFRRLASEGRFVGAVQGIPIAT